MKVPPEFASGSPLLDSLYIWIAALVKDMGIEICDIAHNQYQEAYTFMRNGELARINISYKSDGRISAINPAKYTPFSMELAASLGKLKDRKMQAAQNHSSEHSAESSAEIMFPDDFLKELYLNLQTLLAPDGIQITDVSHLQYCEKVFL